MAQNNREKDWDDYANSLKQENPHLDPPGYGGDALPSGSSSEQGESRFLTKLFQTVLANPVLDASKALKTPQERRAEFEAARRLQNELGLDALEANRRVRAQRDAEYRRTGTEALRRLLEEAYGLDLGSGTPPPVSNAGAPNLRLPDFPDLSEAIEAQMLRDLDTSAIAEQNRRFGEESQQTYSRKIQLGDSLVFDINGNFLAFVSDGKNEVRLLFPAERAPSQGIITTGGFYPAANPSNVLPQNSPQFTFAHSPILPLKVNELLDRAYWIFGESRGEFAEYYAHTINNLRKDFSTEDEMYRRAMTDYDGFRKGRLKDGNTNYTEFYNTRKNGILALLKLESISNCVLRQL